MSFKVVSSIANSKNSDRWSHKHIHFLLGRYDHCQIKLRYSFVHKFRSRGANLLEVDGEEELSKLREAFPELKDSTLWIGVARQKVARQPNVQNSKANIPHKPSHKP